MYSGSTGLFTLHNARNRLNKEVINEHAELDSSFFISVNN